MSKNNSSHLIVYTLKQAVMPKILIPPFIILNLLWISGCAPTRPKQAFENLNPPPAPHYANPQSWAAWPYVHDLADSTPVGLKQMQEQSQADVFFLHPTSYLRKRGHDQWNADIADTEVNRITDEGAILYQASIFNEVGRVYAPRYRQAHYEVFFTKDSSSARKAVDLAYSDIRKAFEYFLRYESKGRPIILAGHSQGALHLIRLLKDYFDQDDSLSRRLVVAYAVGYPIPKDAFTHLKACQSEHENACICSWRSYKIGHKPNFLNEEAEVMITNPLSWKITGEYVSRNENLGAVLDGFDRAPVEKMSGAQIYRGILWVDKPKFKFSFLYPFSNFHRGDFNIFYMNVRQNVKQRLNAFWRG